MSLPEAVRGAARRGASSPWPFVMGQIVSYDPATHFVVAKYDVVDREGGLQEIQTPPSQLMTPFWGENYGEQVGPEPNAQCLIAIIDPQGNQFIVLGFTSNDLNPGLGAKSSERYIVDKRGSSFKLTEDGGTPGDGAGGLKTVAKAYHSAGTAGGHSDVFSDAAGAEHMTRTASDGSSTIHDAVTHEVSQIAPNVTLGARLADMDSTNAVFNHAHMTSYENLRQTANLDDLIANANLDHALGIITGPQLTAKLLQLVGGFTSGVSLSGLGSPAVKAKT